MFIKKKKMSEERKTIIDIVVDSFGKMVKAFKEHGFLLATYVFLLFLILYSFIINPININSIVEHHFEKEKEEKELIDEQAFEKRINIENKLMPLLTKIVDDNPEVTRAMIFSLHNGTKTKRGIDLLYLSCTFESLASDSQNLEYIADNFQKQSLNSMFVNGVGQFAYKNYLYFSNIGNDGNSNSRFLKKLKMFGINSVLIVPIKDDNGYPLSLLVLSSERSFDPQKEYQKLEPSLQSLNNILSL